MKIRELIWIVNDDRDDQEIITEIFEDLQFGHDAVFFDTAEKFLQSLTQATEAPYIVLCEVNLPKMDGFVLREKMLEHPNSRFHGVPFIFWSEEASEHQIDRAYKLRAHGFFVKEPTVVQWKESLQDIIRYWHKSKTPEKAPGLATKL